MSEWKRVLLNGVGMGLGVGIGCALTVIVGKLLGWVN